MNRETALELFKTFDAATFELDDIDAPADEPWPKTDTVATFEVSLDAGFDRNGDRAYSVRLLLNRHYDPKPAKAVALAARRALEHDTDLVIQDDAIELR
jgi:hypothetical protein